MKSTYDINVPESVHGKLHLAENRVQKLQTWEPPFIRENSNTKTQSIFAVNGTATVEPVQFKHSQEAVCAHLNGVRVSFKHMD